MDMRGLEAGSQTVILIGVIHNDWCIHLYCIAIHAEDNISSCTVLISRSHTQAIMCLVIDTVTAIFVLSIPMWLCVITAHKLTIYTCCVAAITIIRCWNQRIGCGNVIEAMELTIGWPQAHSVLYNDSLSC